MLIVCMSMRYPIADRHDERRLDDSCTGMERGCCLDVEVNSTIHRLPVLPVVPAMCSGAS